MKTIKKYRKLVRELSWENRSSNIDKHFKLLRLAAWTSFGWYAIQKHWSGQGYLVCFDKYFNQELKTGGSHFWTLKEAKDWAHEDFKNRVLECLKTK